MQVIVMKQHHFRIKMKRKCGVVHCRTDGVKFKPSTDEQRMAWKRIVKYTGRAVREFTVCEHHFSQDQFDVDLRSESRGLEPRYKKLVRGAVPNINLVDSPSICTSGFSDHSYASVSKVRRVVSQGSQGAFLNLEVNSVFYADHVLGRSNHYPGGGGGGRIFFRPP